MSKKFLFVFLLILTLSLSLVACNPKEETKVTYEDIYVQHDGISPYESYVTKITLPTGIEPYYTTKNSSKIYSSTYDEDVGIVFCQQTVDTTTKYGFFRVAGNTFIGEMCSYNKDFFVTYGIICASITKDVGGKEDTYCVAMREDGSYIISKENGIMLDSSLSNMLVPLSSDYLAVNIGKSSYIYNIYNVKTGEILKNGDNPITIKGGSSYNLRAFDDYLVRTEYYSASSSSKKIQDVKVYNIKTGEALYDAFNGLESLTSTTATTTTRAVFYLGNGKFYCYNQVSGSEDAYQYKTTSDSGTVSYFKITLWTYDIVNKQKEQLSADKIFTAVINKYYSEEVSRDVESYIKDGYSYISECLIRDSKKDVTVEQYIIDSDLNTYVSLCDHSGTATKYDQYSTSYRDVMLTFVDGYGFSSEVSGDILVYDTKGNTVLKVEGQYSNVFVNNGVVTATKTVDSSKYFVAYTIDGREIFGADRQYVDLCGSTYKPSRFAFVGKYVIVKDSDNNIYLVDSNGAEVQQLTDIYVTNSQPYFYAGLYVTKSSGLYGLKNYDGDVIFDNSFKNVVIDKRGTNEVIFYANDGSDWSIYFFN